MEFLFAAYTIVWVVFFGYMFALRRTVRSLNREIRELKELVDTQQKEK